MLNFSRLALRRGSRLLFEDVDFIIHSGQKVGLTGGNGTGKSSLFLLILNQIQADAGELGLPAGLSIAHVAQETPSVELPAIEYVLDGDPELRRIEQALRAADQAGDGHAQAELYSQLEHIGGYDARARASRLLHGLGFGIDEDEAPVSSFSGGWRMRLNLAQALMCRSDLLLLDEPTNHLDLDAVIWLEEWLRSYQGTLLLISHDRDFLDKVVNRIAHVENSRISLYTGNYSAFENIRAERLAHQKAAHVKQQREIAHMHSYVERFRAKATKAKQAQSRLKALARMELIAPAHVDSPFHFEFSAARALPTPLLRLEDSSVGYNGIPVIENVNLMLAPGDRIGLLGPNGAGKSTLIKLIAGELASMSGRNDAAKELRIGYFAQHQLEQLDLDASALLHLQRIDNKATEQQLRNFLGGFGFMGDRVLEPVAPYSGGEKARLVLALLVWKKPNLLLLDEPTNHLDLEMRLALNIALQGFSGAVVLVSHDRHLLRTVADRLLLVDDGGVREFDQDLEAYPAWLAGRRKSKQKKETVAKTDTPAVSRKALRQDNAKLRQQIKPLRQRQRRLEKQMDKLTRRKEGFEARLADASLYEDSGKEQLPALLHDQAVVVKELGEMEEEWLSVTDELQTVLDSCGEG